jgi:protein ImuA
VPFVPNQDFAIEALREQIRRLERRSPQRSGIVGSGRHEVDALLPGGGFPRGALADLSGGPASGKTLLALSVLAEAQRQDGLVSFVDGRGELYPPAASVLGLDLARLLVVRRDGAAEASPPAPRAIELLWASETLLASGAFAAVAIDVPLAEVPAARVEAMLRRLQAAAGKGGAVGLWLGALDVGYRVPAALRLEIAPSGSERPARVRHARAPKAEHDPTWAPGGGGRAA